jgi:hypothetical protein
MGSGEREVEIGTGAARGIGTVDDRVHGTRYSEPVSFVTGEILHIDGGASAGH